MELIKVLIVDDDRIIINGLIAMAEWKKSGFEVVATAINGKQGLDRLKEHSPQVVFTDIKMPVMDGLDMIKSFRSENTAVRFIVLSAFGEFHFAKQALELGAYSYILKDELNPGSMESLLEKLRAEIENQAISAFTAIQDVVLSYLKGAVTDLDRTAYYISQQFERYLNIREDYGLSVLTDSLGQMLSQAFERMGKSASYSEPTCSDRYALQEWAVEQLRRIDGWKDAKWQNLSPVVSNAVFFINENYCKKSFSVHAVSEHVSMSEGRLSVLFKRELGQTMNEFVTDLRINRAKNLLGQGRYRVYEVAEMVGYGSAEYFYRVFTKTTGYPPHKHRKG